MKKFVVRTSFLSFVLSFFLSFFLFLACTVDTNPQSVTVPQTIIWKDSFANSDEIENPEYLWAYYNTTDGCSYIFDGEKWTLLAASGKDGADGADGINGTNGADGKDGKDGTNGKDGVDSVNARVVILYVLNGGTLPEDAPTIYTYGRKTPMLLLEPYQDGFHFDGFYINADFSGNRITELDDSYAYGQVLFAKWSYTVTLNYNDSRQATSEVVDFSSEYTLKDAERFGYTFEGWYTDEKFTEETKVLSLESSYGDIVLFAKWNIITYTIKYVLSAGETNDERNVTTYTVEDEVVLYDASYRNTDFTGWYSDALLKESVNGWQKGTKAEPITLYPKFNDLFVSIVYPDGQWERIHNLEQNENFIEGAMRYLEMDGGAYEFIGYLARDIEFPTYYGGLSVDGTIIDEESFVVSEPVTMQVEVKSAIELYLSSLNANYEWKNNLSSDFESELEQLVQHYYPEAYALNEFDRFGIRDLFFNFINLGHNGIKDDEETFSLHLCYFDKETKELCCPQIINYKQNIDFCQIYFDTQFLLMLNTYRCAFYFTSNNIHGFVYPNYEESYNSNFIIMKAIDCRWLPDDYWFDYKELLIDKDL